MSAIDLAVRRAAIVAAIAQEEGRQPGFFLTPDNPLATRDQIETERLALALLATEPVRVAVAQARQRWRTMAGIRLTPEAEGRFEELITEYAYCYALKAANADAGYPRFVAGLYDPPHDWFGLTVPGSRGSGGDGPDQNYAFFPVEHGAHYRVTGRRISPACADTTYTVTGSLGFTMTLGDLDARAMRIEPDGRFAITIGPQTRADDPNHLATAPDARFVFVRECRSDWREVPMIHRVERIDPPRLPPLTFDEQARRAARFIVDDACAMFWLSAMAQTIPANTMTPVMGSAGVGGLTTQCISFGRAVLAEDEALVVTVGGRDAPFRNMVAHDFWFRTLDYWRRTSNLNNAQSRPDPRGGFTYVVARRDPGVANWIDTGGLSEVVLVHRWQGLVFDPEAVDAPTVTFHHLPLSRIGEVMDLAHHAIDASGRAEQIVRRRDDFALRYGPQAG